MLLTRILFTLSAAAVLAAQEQPPTSIGVVKPEGPPINDPIYVKLYVNIIVASPGHENKSREFYNSVIRKGLLDPFRPYGIGFVLKNTTWQVNDRWTSCKELEGECETSYKKTMHKGGRDTLNLYFVNRAQKDFQNNLPLPEDANLKQFPWRDCVVVEAEEDEENLLTNLVIRVIHWLGAKTAADVTKDLVPPRHKTDKKPIRPRVEITVQQAQRMHDVWHFLRDPQPITPKQLAPGKEPFYNVPSALRNSSAVERVQKCLAKPFEEVCGSLVYCSYSIFARREAVLNNATDYPNVRSCLEARYPRNKMPVPLPSNVLREAEEKEKKKPFVI